MSQSNQLTRVALVNQALKGLDPSIRYEATPAVAKYLTEEVENLPSLTEVLPHGYDSGPLIAIIKESGAKFKKLASISDSLKDAIIRLQAFDLSRENLQVVVPGHDNVSLDTIRLANTDVYNYILTNILIYVSSLSGEDTSISHTASLEVSVGILNDIADRGEEHLALVLTKTAHDWRVEDISEVDTKAWHALAELAKFPPTFENVRLYIKQFELDPTIAKLLVASRHFQKREQKNDEEHENAVVALAQEVINAKARISEPQTRVELANSLHPTYHLDFPSPFELGNLAGLMIESDQVADSVQTFQLILGATADWKTMEFAISKSREYSRFVMPSILPPQSASQLLGSQMISDEVKQEVVRRSSEFLDSNNLQAQQRLAKEALRLNEPLSAEAVEALAAAKVGPMEVLPFVTPLLDTLDLDQLSGILTKLGGDYAKIAMRSFNRPKFSKGRHIEALVSRLKQLGIVSTIDENSSEIRVNMRHP